MTEEVLGRAQAILTIIIVPASLILGVWASIARARQQRADQSGTVQRQTILQAVIIFISGAVGLALTVIGALQLGIGAGGYAVLNVLLGLSIIFLAIRQFRKRV